MNPAEKVLVVMNRFQGYEKTIPEVLGRLGFSAKWCDARSGNDFFSKALLRAGISQKVERVSRANVLRVAEAARQHDADTLLLISPENLRSRELGWLRDELPEVKIILYLYDSAQNRYLDQAMIDGVDFASSFDVDDCAKFENLEFLPLPHSHREFTPSGSIPDELVYDLCFIGTARVRRIRVLSAIARQARRHGDSYYFYLFAPSLPQYLALRSVALLSRYDGVLSRESVPFDTYLRTLETSACAVDIEQTNQGGLTIRTMDAVFAGRPFATSNSNIVRHDFFEHFPISVFSAENPHVEVPKSGHTSQAIEYFKKYQIDYWLKSLLARKVETYVADARSTVSEPSS